MDNFYYGRDSGPSDIRVICERTAAGSVATGQQACCVLCWLIGSMSVQIGRRGMKVSEFMSSCRASKGRGIQRVM